MLPDERELGLGPRPNMGEPAQLTPEREVLANTHTLSEHTQTHINTLAHAHTQCIQGAAAAK